MSANNLIYPIHPVFQRDLWECWDLQYELITPALRLASAFLESPASVAFHFAMINNPRTRCPDRSARYEPWGVNYNQFLPTELPDSDIRESVDSSLRRLVPLIHWRFNDRSDPDSEDMEGAAWTIVNKELPVIKGAEEEIIDKVMIDKIKELAAMDMPEESDDEPSDIPDDVPDYVDSDSSDNEPEEAGIGSIIEVTIEHLHTFVYLQQQNQQTPLAISQMLRLQCEMAVTLCHELTHAINNAVSRDIEPFFGGQSFAELGDSWTQEVFNGNLATIGDEGGSQGVHAPLVISKWPNHRWPHEPRNSKFERRLPKPKSTLYFVPMQWISAVQQQSFWDAVRDSSDRNYLHTQKTVGWQETSNSKNINRDWRSPRSSEGRWPGDELDRVFRDKTFKQKLNV